MVSMADPVTRRQPKPRVYMCALCDKPVKIEEAVYSSWTGQRFHPTCIWRRK